jgi:hypothetical protein
MLLISLSPLRWKKLVAAFTVLVALAGVCCFAQPIFFEVESTPYDHQMAPVQPVLASVGGFSLEGVSLPIVNGWMNELRAMRYGYSRQWKTPGEVETARVGDCKGKAITLYERLQLNGATNVRFVIGKHRAGDWFTHAWVEWEMAEGIYILDPTFNRTAAALRERSAGKYIPLYAYEGALKYRAMNATLVAERPLRAVASGR